MSQIFFTTRGILSISYIVWLLFCTSCKENTLAKPNVIWIVCEDLSPDLGCYGNELVQTPQLDSLAKEGIRFTNVFATVPACSPSRTAFATGIYQTSIGAHHIRYPDSLMPFLLENIQSVAQIFKQYGCTTATIKDAPGKGKTDWMRKVDIDENFDYHHWRELAMQVNPSVAHLSMGRTHQPFTKAKEGQFPLKKLSIPPYLPNYQVTRKDFADYYSSIEELDHDVKQVLDSLKQYGFAKNTFVIFFLVHGRPMIHNKA